MQTKGFTLIELLVTIAIISLFALVVIQNLSLARQKARDVTRLSQINQMQKAIELYIDEHGKPPLRDSIAQNYASSCIPADWDLLRQALKPYISDVPVDPLNQGAYCYAYGPWLQPPAIQPGSECEIDRYGLFFATEAQDYKLPQYVPGSMPRFYCIQ